MSLEVYIAVKWSLNSKDDIVYYFYKLINICAKYSRDELFKTSLLYNANKMQISFYERDIVFQNVIYVIAKFRFNH